MICKASLVGHNSTIEEYCLDSPLITRSDPPERCAQNGRSGSPRTGRKALGLPHLRAISKVDSANGVCVANSRATLGCTTNSLCTLAPAILTCVR